jgi:SSS family solute:Na+ symporter
VNETPILGLAVLVGCLVAMAAMGLWFGRKNKAPDHFMKAGGVILDWAVGLSTFSTYDSSISLLALLGKASATNWNAMVFSLTIPFVA